MATPRLELSLEEMPQEHRDWLEKLVEPLLRYSEDMAREMEALPSPSSLGGVVIERDVTGGSTQEPWALGSGFPGPPMGVLFLGAEPVSGAPAISSVALKWVPAELERNLWALKVSEVVGPAAGARYRLRFLVLGSNWTAPEGSR